ncbi:MAG: hypothetical protein AAFU78_08095 [Cyanobacteria bacterium J06633_2]
MGEKWAASSLLGTRITTHSAIARQNQEIEASIGQRHCMLMSDQTGFDAAALTCDRTTYSTIDTLREHTQSGLTGACPHIFQISLQFFSEKYQHRLS